MFLRWFVWACVPCLLLAACKKQASESASGTALYGKPTGTSSANIPRLKPISTNEISWKDAPFACVQTELSPATLYHSTSKYLGLFTGMTNSGLGTPSYVAFATAAGPKIYKNGTNIQADLLEECWLLAWFEGAAGWTNWDSPWAIFLQHKPTSIALDHGGLHLGFASGAGDVVVMPLYGYYKPPFKTNDFLLAHGLPSKKIKTWVWSNAISKDPLMRVRYWASAMREFPLYCEDTFSVDSSTDSVIIRQKFTWHSIRDDWKTQPLKLAPVSPPLGQASLDKDFPVKFSRLPVNLEVFTPYGPYMAVENVDSYEVTLPVLKYVHETEASDPPGTNVHPTVLAALDKLQKTAQNKFTSPDKYEYDHGGLNNFCWAIQGDQWYAKTLPYMDGQTRSNALASLHKYFSEDVLVTNRFKAREYPKGSGREYLILEGPGIGSWNVLGDAGKFSANMIETLWTYAHFTGDWELIRERWPLIKKLFITPAETRWAGFGRDAIAELGDEAPPCAAMARLAYKVGDMDTYNYACYMYARELVHHFLKQRGKDLFRKSQPWHSMEVMDEEVYLTNLWGDTAGWQIDGPKYPSKASERQFNNRWVRFKDADTARFYRDVLGPDVRAEMDRLLPRWDAKRKYQNDSHGMPSLVQLRSLLLNESPADLAKVATPNQFTGPPSGILASCWSVIRTSHPTRHERLIPGGAPSPFVTGLERSVPGPNPYLIQTVLTKTESSTNPQTTWPLLTWWKSWKTPTGARWNVGYVTPVMEGPAPEPIEVPISWNTRAFVYRMP
jgi:hypothetical protein